MPHILKTSISSFAVTLLVILSSLSCTNRAIRPSMETVLFHNEEVAKKQNDLAHYIDRYRDRRFFPSFEAGVVVGDTLAWQHTCDTTVNETYPVASITKIFTALAVMQLEEQGLVDLDTPISHYLKGVSIARPELKSPKVTVRHLLSHSSGLPDVRHFRPRTYSRADGLYLNGRKFKLPAQVVPAGRHYRYSNHGFMLLGFLVEKNSGMPYKEYIQKNIYDPVGMTDAETSKNLTGAGGVKVSLQDMHRFAAMWLNEGRAVTGERVIKGKTLEKMLQLQLYIPYAEVKRYVGLGWRARRDADGVRTYFHIGGADYISAWLQVFPRHNCAVIYLGNPPEYTPALMAFLTAMQSKLAHLASAMVGADVPVHDFHPTMPTEEQEKTYLGIYKSPVTDVVTRIYRRNDRLYLSNRKERACLLPYTSHIYYSAREIITYDFVHRPGVEKPDGLATYYDYFERIGDLPEE